jgi:hypothetical protein
MKNDKHGKLGTPVPSAAKTASSTIGMGDRARGSLRRRDATGHLNPEYAAGLRADGKKPETANAMAFLHRMRSADSLTEQVGEAFVRAALSGEYAGEDAEPVDEEVGGPFIETRAKTEFAGGTDPSNPEGATREPFPKS